MPAEPGSTVRADLFLAISWSTLLAGGYVVHAGCQRSAPHEPPRIGRRVDRIPADSVCASDGIVSEWNPSESCHRRPARWSAVRCQQDARQPHRAWRIFADGESPLQRGL